LPNEAYLLTAWRAGGGGGVGAVPVGGGGRDSV